MPLYYAHDPMCSWCWAFRPTLEKLSAALPADLQTCKLLGGLAPDTDRPMPLPMREQIRATWQHIQQSVPGTEFNYDFWKQCQPRRSTWMACRAVLVAAKSGLGDEMTSAIQRAYYLQARNPSDITTLIELAEALGLSRTTFADRLNSAETRNRHQAEIQQCLDLGIDSYPSLVLVSGPRHWSVPIDYLDVASMLETILSLRTGPASGLST